MNKVYSEAVKASPPSHLTLSRRPLLTQEVEVAVSPDLAIALQPGQQAQTSISKKKKVKKKVVYSYYETLHGKGKE